jgi:DNA-binding response OmpR family regulator
MQIGSFWEIADAGTTPGRIGVQLSKNPSDGIQTILFVDDEEALQQLAFSILKMEGYQVILASDGDEAVKIFEDLKDTIDVVVSDMKLPKKNGLEMFRMMRLSKPDVRVILASGSSEPEVKAQVLEEGVMSFVQKPYTPDDLVKAIRAVLGTPQEQEL